MVQALEAGQKMIDGELHTKDSVVVKYANLVHYSSNKRRKYAQSIGFTYDDLVSEGFIGLLKAFDKFDESRDIKFATFAYHYVFGEIRKSYRDRGNIGINYSRQIKEFAYSIRKSGLENEPISVIVEKTGIEEHHVAYALDYLINRTPTSIDQPVEHTDESLLLSEVIGEEEDETVYYVKDFLQSLSERDRIITQLLMDGQPQRLIGLAVGISQMQVSRSIGKIKTKYLEFERVERN